MKILTTLIISFFVIFHSNSFSATKEPLTVMQEIKALGVFAEPKVYPAGMLESFSKSCVKFYCRANKATKTMSKTFQRGPKYNQRYPGEQLYALAQFELYYLQQLKQNQKNFKNLYLLGQIKKSMEKM